MGAITTHEYVQDNGSYLHLDVAVRRMHWLREPKSVAAAHVWANVAYQMRYSVSVLEEALAQEGEAHVLQLACTFAEGEIHTPVEWKLYADGTLVASGSGAFARACFEEAAERFLDVCREAVEAAALPALSEHDYRMLSMAREVSRLSAVEQQRLAS